MHLLQKKISFTPDYNDDYIVSEQYYFNKGDVIDAVMVFNKTNDIRILSEDDLDNIDFCLVKADTEEFVAYAYADSSNVETIEYTIPESGYYEFWVGVVEIADPNYPPEVSIVFNVE